ncbi:unnamed protein product [Plutella xylostella]|uniref:(diamondback moth) hypothetical protein n=1 Tax=Plutella xylostella TaxID=51655 RepID=A0A8S4FQZ1_PLUXY|nr:unnamed protein product [Plutella xylostella]
MEDFEIFINFDCPSKAYYPGQIVSGYIEFKLHQTQTFTVILVQFLGEAEVNWEEKYDTCSDREEYFDYTYPVLGGNGTPVTLSPGTHKYQFQYQVPFTAPSSFEGSLGKVWYRVLAGSEQPGCAVEWFEEDFYVVAPVDLNADPAIKQPMSFDFEQVYSCCLCQSDPVCVRVSLPACGYCPGQVVPVKVEVENDSGVEVKKIKFEIVQKESYSVQNGASQCTEPERPLAPGAGAATLGPVLAGAHREKVVELTVPPMIVPNLSNCRLIDVKYYFKITLQVTGCNDDEEDEQEIFLGSIPLAGLQGNYTHPLQDKLPQGSIPPPPAMPIPPIIQPNIAQFTVPGNQAQPMHYGSQTMYPPYQNQMPYPNQSPYNPMGTGQNNPYPQAASPQINWQWNGNSAPQVGFVTGSTSPSAPPE